MAGISNLLTPHGWAALRTLAATGLVLALAGCSGTDPDPSPAPGQSGTATTSRPTKEPVAVNQARPDDPGRYTASTLEGWAKAYRRAPRELSRIADKRPKVPTRSCVALDSDEPTWSSVVNDPDSGEQSVLFGLQDNPKQAYDCGDSKTLVVKIDLSTGQVLQGPRVAAAIQRRADRLG